MTMISDYHNYYETGYITLPVKPGNLPDSISAEGITLYKKSEFHITLLSTKRIAKNIDEANEDKLEAEIVEEFKKFIVDKPIKDFRILPEFRFVKRDERKTVVVMVETENLKDFFGLLRNKYKTNIPDQPTHVTIYSLDPEFGISISSKQDLERDTKVIDIPELQDITIFKPR